jgi:hypothetical protein
MNGVANGLYGGDLPNQINTPWIDFSEQSSIIGWSSFTTKIIRYKVVGNIVHVTYFISGISNSTTTSFTVPFLIKISGASATALTVDNGTATTTGYLLFSANSNNLLARKPISRTDVGSSATWTASGTKEIQGQLFYEI